MREYPKVKLRNQVAYVVLIPLFVRMPIRALIAIEISPANKSKSCIHLFIDSSAYSDPGGLTH